MILKTFIGFVTIAAFIISVLCIEAVCRWIKSMILRTRFGEWYKNSVKSYADNIGMIVAMLLIIGVFTIVSWELGTWIMG